MIQRAFSVWVILLGLSLCASTASALSLIAEPPQPSELGSETALSVNVTDLSGEALIRWDFGDGAELDFAPNQQAVTHTYTSPGHYSVIVVVQDDVSFSSASYVHTVHTPLKTGRAQSSSSIAYDPSHGRVAVANPDNDTVTLIDTESLTKLFELQVLDQPESLVFLPNGKLCVLHREDPVLALVDVDKREIVGRVELPRASQPIGLVLGKDGSLYVTLMATGQVARLDPSKETVAEIVDVGPWPRGIAANHDGSKLYVTRFLSGEGEGQVTVLEAEPLRVSSIVPLPEDTTTPDTDQQGRGLPNYLFSVALSPDGTEAWVPGKKDNLSRGLRRDGLSLTQDNTVRPMVSVLDLGAEQEDLGSRMDLDDRNLPAHVTFSPLGDYAFVSLIGSSLVEVRDAYTKAFVTVLRGTGLGPRASLLTENGRLFVHADLARSVSVFDVSKILSGEEQLATKLTDISLVEQEKLSEVVLFGKRIFYDSEDKRMTQEGYISCASCHFEGFEDGRVWDFSDRGEGFRNTTSLLGRAGTAHGRVHWSGNFDEVQDFEGAMRHDFGGTGFLDDALFEEGSRSSPLGLSKAGLSTELDALAAYVTSLASFPESPYRNQDGTLSDAARRGEQLFLATGCDGCHTGEAFTNSPAGELYDVGTIEETSGERLGEELSGLDTPTLLGIWQTAPYLHDGSAQTLKDVLTVRNGGDLHGVTSSLSEQELDDLVRYLLELEGPSEDNPSSPPPSDPSSSSDEATSRGCVFAPRDGSHTSWLSWVFLLFGALLRRTRFAQ